MPGVSREFRVSNAKMRALRVALTGLVMCGWSVMLTGPIALWLSCGPSRLNGFTALCGELWPPMVYSWLGLLVIIFGAMSFAAMFGGAKVLLF